MNEFSKYSVYKGFWKCRDLEIQMLWTRLTLLGAFMALTYTGYGVLILKAVDGIKHWEVFNLLAIGACCFGAVFAYLWVATAKGSKFWYEQYETALKLFQKDNRELFEKTNGDDLILSYLDFDNPRMEAERPKVDGTITTTNGGSFSVSKIPIVLGQVSLLAWSCIAVAHVWCLFAGRDYMRLMINGLCMNIAMILILGTAFVLAMVGKRIKSSFV